MNKRKLFLISNMYPSEEHIRYGIFVENFEKALENDYDIRRMVLTKRTTVISKFLGYCGLYLKILTLPFKVKDDDIIYVHFPLHLAPALWVVKFLKKNMILNFHGSDLIFDTIFRRLLSLFLDPLVKKCSIVVPSNYYKIKIIKIYSKIPSMVFVYPSGGINTSIFYPREVQKRDVFVLGFVSNFIESKGWEIFLQAVQSIVKNNSIKNIEIIMVGEGPDRQKINKLLEKINVNFHLIQSVSQEKLAEIYNSFDVFLFPTYKESLGLVGLEAMACGTSIIASRVEGPMSYISDGVNGYLFEKKNAHDLEKKIIQFYNLSTEETERLVINGINTAKLYDHTIVNKNLLSFLMKL